MGLIMLDSLKQTSRNIGQEIGRAWGSLSEGWRALRPRSSHAVTYFAHSKYVTLLDDQARVAFPSWSLLVGEVEETGKELVVRVEMPGMKKEDCRITIEDNTLYLSGEKRIERESQDRIYHVMERAYGSFKRAIALPGNVDIGDAQATYKNGVLTVRLPKEGGETGRSVPMS